MSWACNVHTLAKHANSDYLELKLESGATLKSKSVIVATRARWREMNVPGEREYRGKGWRIARIAMVPCLKEKTLLSLVVVTLV